MNSAGSAVLSSSDLELLGNSVDRFLLGRRACPEGPGGFDLPDPAAWAGLAELGVIGLPFADEHGGLGLGGPALSAVMRALGRRLSTEPYLSSVILGGGMLRHLAPPEMRATLAPVVASGAQRATLAFAEPGARYNSEFAETRARAVPSGFVLDGMKTGVLDAPDADFLFVSACIDEPRNGSKELGVFLVERNTPGITVTGYNTIDGRSAGIVKLDAVGITRDAELGRGSAVTFALELVLDEARLGLAAEAVGAIEEINRQTLEYCRTRTAFGQPLSRQQAIQHRLVDMHVASEYASAMVDAAAEAFDGEPRRRALMIAAAAAVVAREADMIGKAAVQLHGAVGTTEELPIGRYFKRLLANDRLLGGYAENSTRYRNMLRTNLRSDRDV